MARGMTEEQILASQFMFQYNWRHYNLEQSVQRSIVEDWPATAFRDLFRAGQRVYFMRSAAGLSIAERKFSAVGRIVSPTYQRPHPQTGELAWQVDVVYDYLVTPNYTQAKIVGDSDAEFKKFNAYVEGPYGTNFLLPSHIATRTDQVVRPFLRPITATTSLVHKQIFVSYSRTDSEFVGKLVQDMRQRLGGHDETVWMDTQQLTGGQAFIEKIEGEIRDRPVFLVVVSPDSMASNFVDHEVKLAIHMDLSQDTPGRKVIVPVLYRAAVMPPGLGLHQGISFQSPRPYEESLNELMTLVNQVK
jgi:hypothetical protein